MARQFSDHYNNHLDDSTQTKESYDSERRVPSGRGDIAAGSAAAGSLWTTDEFRIMTLKPSDRITEIKCFHDDTGTTGTINLGLYLSGFNNDGAVIDADLFASLQVLTTAASYATPKLLWNEANNFDDIRDRGRTIKELYEIVAGAGTWNDEDWGSIDLVATFTVASDIATQCDIGFEVEFAATERQ